MRRFNYSTSCRSYFLVLALLIAFSVGPIAPLSFSASGPSAVTHIAKPLESSTVAGLERPQINNALDKLPRTFEPNMGQLDKSVKFSSRGSDYSLLLTATEAVFSFSQLDAQQSRDQSLVTRQPEGSQTAKRKTAVVRMKMVGANAKPRIEGLGPQSAKTSYFIGNDPNRWRTNTPSYQRTKYVGAFPGIDLEFYGNQQQVKYDFIVAPSADPRRIKLEFKGADRIEVDAHGDLVLHTSVGEVRQHKPVIYQKVEGIKKEVAGHFVLRGRKEVGFSVERYDTTKQLVIDPAIVYSTYLGGSERAAISDIATYTDPVTGNTYAYVIGATRDQDFPTKNAIQPNYSGHWSLFVTKINMTATGTDSLVYSTYLGGNGDASGYGIAVDSTGAAYLTGQTKATDFPLANAFKTTTDGDDAFVTKVRPDGSGLVYSTYMGGAASELAYCIAVDTVGNAYVGGSTSSINFPLLNAFRSAPAAGFISKIAPPSGTNPASLTYSTYIDGTPLGIAVDLSGNAYAAGTTSSYNLPTTANAFQPINIATISGNGTGFITKVNTLAAGQASLAYSTYFGGSYGGGDPNPFASNGCQDIAVDSAGNAYVAGNALASDFPTTPNSLKPTFDDDADAFVAKLDTTKSGSASLVYSTLLGGHGGRSGADQAFGIEIDAAGNAYVVGIARSADFPIANSFQSLSTGVFVTANEGSSFAALNKGLLSYNYKSLTLDTSTVPRTLYTIVSDVFGATHDTILKSIDGGNNWSPITSQPPSGVINCMELDPQNPATVYVGTYEGIFKSIDGGNGWSAINNGLSYGATTYVSGFTFDTTATSQTVYVVTSDNLYKSTDGGNTWIPTGLNSGADTLVINTATTPHTLFAAGRRSTDGGNTWAPTVYQNDYRCSDCLQILAVDTSTIPASIYATDPGMWDYDFGFFMKSTDNGDTWQDVFFYMGFHRLIIDTTTAPSTLYADTGGISKSTDGGSSWTSIAKMAGSGQPFAIDTSSRTSTTPSTLYFAHGGADANAFVSELNPTGSALIFSTLLGGPGGGAGATCVALDTQGNIYVAGGTEGWAYPTLNAFQPDKLAVYTGFLTKLGSAALPPYSGSSVTTQVAVQSGTLAITLPNITGSTTGTQPAITVTPLDSTATANLTLSNSLGAYEIKTTATYNTSGYPTDPTKGIKIAFPVPSVNDPTVFNNLVLTHGEDANNDGIIQPTEMIPYNGTVDQNKLTNHDFATRTVWAYVPSLSPFVIIKGAGDQISDLLRTVKSFNLKAGIENSLDAKLQNAFKAKQAALAKDRATACNQMSAFNYEVQAQIGKALTQAQATQLIKAANQIKLVLGCR